MKHCLTCRCEKEESQFPRSRARRDGLYPYCKVCSANRARKYRLENPEAKKRADYKGSTGISLEQYSRKLLEQKGGCAICNQPESGRRLHVDHDHDTGEIRSLLCNRCNRGLGFFLDRADLTDKATDYLRRFKPVYEG